MHLVIASTRNLLASIVAFYKEKSERTKHTIGEPVIPGPNEPVRCPRCGAIEKYRTLLSGNTFGASLWTDGKMFAPMFPVPPAVVCCQTCGACHWLSKARPSGSGKHSCLDDAPFVREPDVSEYHAALESGIASSPVEEKLVRVFAWWRHDDRFRGPGAPGPVSSAADDETSLRNLLALRNLLSRNKKSSFEREYPEALLRAEVCRQLGQFDDARKLLGRMSRKDDWILAVIETIGELCDEGIRIVRQVDTERVEERRERKRRAREAPAFAKAWLEHDPAGRLEDREVQKAYRAWIESRGGPERHTNSDSMPLDLLGYPMDGPRAIRGARLRRRVPGFFDTGPREWRDTWRKWLEERSGPRRTHRNSFCLPGSTTTTSPR